MMVYLLFLDPKWNHSWWLESIMWGYYLNKHSMNTLYTTIQYKTILKLDVNNFPVYNISKQYYLGGHNHACLFTLTNLGF